MHMKNTVLWIIGITFGVIYIAEMIKPGCLFEVTTVKGNWVSDKFDDGSYCEISFDDDRFVYHEMPHNATVQGVWTSEKDTIFLYRQDKTTEKFVIKQLSMNTMGLETRSGFLLMTREYDDMLHFAQVLMLKGGFWCILGIIFQFICPFLLIGLCIVKGLEGIWEIIKVILNFIGVIIDWWIDRKN